MSLDPAETNAEFYEVIFENDRVRVLEYKDQPGDVTTLHAHPARTVVAVAETSGREERPCPG